MILTCACFGTIYCQLAWPKPLREVVQLVNNYTIKMGQLLCRCDIFGNSVTVNGKRYRVVKEIGEGGKTELDPRSERSDLGLGLLPA